MHHTGFRKDTTGKIVALDIVCLPKVIDISLKILLPLGKDFNE